MMPQYWVTHKSIHTDNAVSKTVNFEEHASREDIEKTYYLAYKSNLKGITVYRNNSRSFQPMNIEKKEVKAEETKVEEIKTEEVKTETVETQFAGEVKVKICPECGTKIEYSEGCFICLGCGYSGCS